MSTHDVYLYLNRQFSERTIQRWAQHGRIAHLRLGNRIRFNKSDIDSYLPQIVHRIDARPHPRDIEI